MNINPRTYLSRSFSDIKNDLELFKEKLVEQSSADIFYTGNNGILQLIACNIKPNKVEESCLWLEQMRFYFSDVQYDDRAVSIDNIRNFIKNNELLQRYLKDKHLKRVNIFFPQIKSENRCASVFYYDKAIAVHNWGEQNINPIFREVLSQIGKLYYIPTVLQGDAENTIKLKKLKENIIKLSGNESINNIDDETFFADMFSLYIMRTEPSSLTYENLGAIIHSLDENTYEIFAKINKYFSEIIENTNRIKRPDFKSKFLNAI